MNNAKTARNAELVEAFLAGTSYRLLSMRFGITETRCCRIVNRWITPEQRAARPTPSCAPLHHNRGRRPIWPDCPEHLLERYTKMKKRIPAAQARETLLRRESLRVMIERDHAQAIDA